MKRPTFIIIGALLVFILLIIWVYVLFFGGPQGKPETFTDLNFDDTTDNSITNLDNKTTDNEPLVNVVGPERLRQLTTKPVAGYQEVQKNASSTGEIFYVEAGTGHIFSINLETGEERRVSGTTIPNVHSGVITPNGNSVMLRSGSGVNNELIIGTVSSTTDSLLVEVIPEKVTSFKATVDNTFLYSVQTNNSVVGKHYDPEGGTSETIFNIPFREAAVVWGDSASDKHYVYPKATSQLEGFLYEVSSAKTKRLPIDGYGLSAQGNSDYIIYSKQVNGSSYQTFVYSQEVGESLPLYLQTIPEKCTPLHMSHELVCAQEITTRSGNLPDAWYQGVTSYVDDLWLIDPSVQSSQLLINVKQVTGRELDIMNIVVSKDDLNLYFTNKADQTLWLYELSQPDPQNE